MTSSCELAKSANKVICARVFGPMYTVSYPWRKTPDLYVAVDNHPVRCCQCDKDIPVDDSLTAWREHIRVHARRKTLPPIVFVGRDNDGQLYAAEETGLDKGVDMAGQEDVK